MNLATTIRGERFAFDGLAEVLAKANEEKSGDQLAGIAARTERERVAAKIVLSELTLGEMFGLRRVIAAVVVVAGVALLNF